MKIISFNKIGRTGENYARPAHSFPADSRGYP